MGKSNGIIVKTFEEFQDDNKKYYKDDQAWDAAVQRHRIRHAEARGLPYVGIEVRQDQIADEAADRADRWMGTPVGQATISATKQSHALYNCRLMNVYNIQPF